MVTALITGASSGLGKEYINAIMEQYPSVDSFWIIARNKEALFKVAEEHTDKTIATISLDLAKDESLEVMEQLLKENNPEIKVLVNNAGYGYRAAVEEGDPEDAERLFQTHFWGPIALIKAVLPSMRARRSGAIINVSSIAGLRTSPGSGYYAAAKCAVEGMSEGLRAELAPLGIKVMVVQPGAFRTEFAGRSLTQSKLVIADYENTAGTRRIGKDLSHGTQPGDPDKGARLVAQAIEALEPPFRLLLGSDAVKFAETVMKDRREEYEKWAYFSRQSDFEEKGSGL